jgi:hypothetical protein
MKRSFTIEYRDDLGPQWLNPDNLLSCLNTPTCCGPSTILGITDLDADAKVTAGPIQLKGMDPEMYFTPVEEDKKSAEIRVVIAESGVVYKYDIFAETDDELSAKAREHCAAIVHYGYRRQTENGARYEHIPPHRIQKVQALGVNVPTDYPDQVEGT